jgi:hypothetical protein
MCGTDGSCDSQLGGELPTDVLVVGANSKTETKVEVQKVLKKENCKKMPPNLSKRLVSGFMC